MRCEVCGHTFAEKHRIIPGKIGGFYTDWNVVFLCPNHHAALHFLMTAFPNTKKADKPRLDGYLQDKQLMHFFEAIHVPLHNLYYHLEMYGHKDIYNADEEEVKRLAQALINSLTQWRREYAIS